MPVVKEKENISNNIQRTRRRVFTGKYYVSKT